MQHFFRAFFGNSIFLPFFKKIFEIILFQLCGMRGAETFFKSDWGEVQKLFLRRKREGQRVFILQKNGFPWVVHQYILAIP